MKCQSCHIETKMENNNSERKPAIRPASYHRIRMTIEIASDSPALFVVADLLLPITIAK